MAPTITINDHSTASSPRPHIVYTVEAEVDGKQTFVKKRYSDFVALDDALATKDCSLPPKRILATTFIPSAWADDQLIAERKAGLSTYLSKVLTTPEYQDSPVLRDFLAPSVTAEAAAAAGPFDLEDALPSTLSRKAALGLKAALDQKTPTLDASDDPGTETAKTFIAAAYYPDWSAGKFPPEKLDYSKFDILFFAFATPNSSSKLDWDSGSQSVLQRLVNSAKKSGKGTKIVLSVGGWSSSHWFSHAVSNAGNRTTFASTLASAVKTYGLDGIDIDWEYPNSAGAGNPHSPSDAANFLSFLKSLRSAIGSSKIISAAVPQLPWIGSNGKPMTDVKEFAAQMTYVNIMNYDVWASSSSPGPNAPLGNLCGSSTQSKASAQAALKQWTAAGFPASKLLLGLPLYGYVSKSTKTVLNGMMQPSPDMVILHSEDSNGDSNANFLNGTHAARLDVTKLDTDTTTSTATAAIQKWYGQQIPFSSIVSSGALVKKDGNYYAGSGFTMGWDDCSDTPYLFNVSQKIVVTYDDTWSLGDKATFAKQNSMAGCFTWSLDQDDGMTLHNAIRSKLGK